MDCRCRSGQMAIQDWVAYMLLLVGGVNWGLVGVFGFNLLGFLGTGMLAKIVYGLVGISGLYAIWTAIKLARK